LSNKQYWALDEAAARNKAEAEGVELQYGVHYSAPKKYAYRKTANSAAERYEVGPDGQPVEEE
jgi:hypothetical protein